jgi:hypothetical protein
MKKSTLITIAALAVSSGMASAAFDAKFIGLTGVNNAIHIDNGGFVDQDFNAGYLTYEYVGPGQRGSGQYESGQFSGFCIELQSISGGTQTYVVDDIKNAPDPVGGAGEDAYDLADQNEVMAVVAAAIRLGWIQSDLSAGANVTNKRLAAIQGKIWEAVLDGSTVTANAVVLTEWNDLTAEIANDPNATVNNLRAMLNADTQDQLFIVPLPTAALAGLMTLGGLAGFSRIRRR